MLVACRLAGLSALEGYYAGVRVGAQCGAALAARAEAVLRAGWQGDAARPESPAHTTTPVNAPTARKPMQCCGRT
jgi:hypothetical protein